MNADEKNTFQALSHEQALSLLTDEDKALLDDPTTKTLARNHGMTPAQHLAWVRDSERKATCREASRQQHLQRAVPKTQDRSF